MPTPLLPGHSTAKERLKPLAVLGLAASFALGTPLPAASDHAAITQTSLQSDIESHFRNPDEEARPWAFWYWLSGNVTPEGITYDLEAMSRAGLGGAYIFAIDRPGYEQYVKVDQPATANSERFWDMVKFAVQEADRLGMRIALNACDGWALAGGPWITPELSMQNLISSTTIVEGGKPLNLRLKQPENDLKAGMWKLDQYKDYYRDVAVLAYPVAPGWGDISEDNLKPAQLITDVDIKNGMKSPRFGTAQAANWTPGVRVTPDKTVPLDKVIDLSGQMDENGDLQWTPPPGRWIIQRFGSVTTGETNRPTSLIGMGLEADKLNPEAIRVQFENWYGQAVEKVGPELAGKVLSMNHSDSWECGSQNWSPVLRDEFIRRRGYDPVKYLPAMTGIPIGSAEESERFLWDFRRTVYDLILDSFFRTSVELTNETGGTYSSETMAGILTDSLEFYREVDVPMNEFWIASHGQGSAMYPRGSSGAHIYGKRFVQAEAFTERVIKWTEDPYFLKALGDFSFANGINRFALHVWAHQAFPDRVPGVTLFNVYGTAFSGNQPWHDLARPWYDYLRRSQAMLQQGIPVADACYFIGEELPNDAIQRQDLNPALPFGYDYDCINRDALLTRASAKNGRMVLPDGVSYGVLVLPNSMRMSPEVAAKIGELATAGVPVIGPRPNVTYSLTDYPESDRKLQSIVSKTWGNVVQGVTPTEVLQANNTPFDVEFIGADMSWVHRGKKVKKNNASWNGGSDPEHKPELEMEYSSPTFASIHRRTEDADFYFVSNQELEDRDIEVAFRVTGRQPELWHPETGEMRPLTDWRVEDGRTIIPLTFTPAESYFIVFREAGEPPAKTVANFGDYQTLGTVEGAWTVDFQPGRGAPDQIELPALASLSENSDEGVKYFSGVATYSRQITAPDAALKSKHGERILLDLGEVQNVAEVTLNGKALPAVWKPPFRVDVTNVIQPGENTVEIKVANTWKNRLIADAALAPDERVTWTLFREKEGWFKPGKDKPIPAGLIGPVSFVKETRDGTH
ncbi:hypothetical protein H5P28_05260 [Ruficoccus amylovorans]|uniref:Beta-mannosidase-like galactose-binding domain-containing protein n=1 Tax=Ruficoccus amylovorans TaxID=1804625 RepID=A0A842HDA1_9BACT|nr:glycosyl hydrolase [Ruficoccus amylovorans]MBC2593666.1 hypothetical protein [Ruficoccus amylovorans]